MCFRCANCGRRECCDPPYYEDQQNFMLTDAFWSYEHPKFSVGWIVVYLQRESDIGDTYPMPFFSVMYNMVVCEMCRLFFKAISRVPSLVNLAAAVLYEAGHYEMKTRSAWRSFLVRKGLKDVADTLSLFGQGFNRCAGANDPDDTDYIHPHITPYAALPLTLSHSTTCMRPINSKKKTRVYFWQQCISCFKVDKKHRKVNWRSLRNQLKLLEEEEEMGEH